MKRSFLPLLALLSGLLLPACGTRSSLTEEPGISDKCGPWSVHDGAAGTVYYDHPVFAVLDDGSVVVPIAEGVADADGGGDIAWHRHRVRKIDPDGTIAWEAVGDSEGVRFTAAARDAADGIYVAGAAEHGAPSVLGAAVTCAGKGTCSFVAKLTQTGEPVWVKAFPSSAATDRAYPSDLAVMDDGRITLEGSFDGTLDLGCGPASGTAGSYYGNRFVARFSPSGECLWSRAIVGPPLWYPADDQMAVGDAGDIALVLNLQGPPGSSVDLGDGPVPFGNEHGSSLAVAKYASDGALVFARVATSGSSNAWPHVAVTGAGEVLLSASYEGTIDLGGGPKGSTGFERQFVTKFGVTGEELWTHDIAAGWDSGGAAPAIAIAPGDSFFLAGRGRPGMAILGEPVPEMALFAAAFDAGGKPIDVHTFPFTGKADSLGLSASAAGALVLVGQFEGALDLGQDPLVSEGPWDAFVARICR